MKNLKHSETEINEKAQILIDLQPQPISAGDKRFVIIALPYENKEIYYRIGFYPFFNDYLGRKDYFVEWIPIPNGIIIINDFNIVK